MQIPDRPIEILLTLPLRRVLEQSLELIRLPANSTFAIAISILHMGVEEALSQLSHCDISYDDQAEEP